MSTIVTRRISVHPQQTRRYSANLLGVTPFLLLISAGLLAAFAAMTGGSTLRTLLILLGVGGMFEALALLLLSPLRSVGHVKPEGFMRATQGIVILAAGAILLTMNVDLRAIAAAFALTGCASAIFAAVVLLWSSGAVRPRIDVGLIRDLLHESLPSFVAAVTVLVYFRLDTLLIAAISGKGETGVYGAAFNVAFGLLFLPAMLGRVLLPRLSRADPRELSFVFRRAACVMVGAASAITAILLAATPFVGRLYGAQFAGVEGVYVLLIVAQALFCGTHLMYVVLLARGRSRHVWAFTTLALGLNLAGNLLLIPWLGAMGAAIAAVFSEGALLAAQAPIVFRMLSESSAHEMEPRAQEFADQARAA